MIERLPRLPNKRSSSLRSVEPAAIVDVMPAPTTVEQTRAPFPVRLLNKCCAALEKNGIRATAPSAAELIDKTKPRCGLDCFVSDQFFGPLSPVVEPFPPPPTLH